MVRLQNLNILLFVDNDEIAKMLDNPCIDFDLTVGALSLPRFSKIFNRMGNLLLSI